MKRSWPVFLVFLAMGFGDVVGPLVGLVKKTFELSNFTAQLLPMTGFLMFGLLSVPMGLVQDRKGKKTVLMVGLVLALAGLMLPLLTGMYGKPIEVASGDLTKYYVVLVSILLLCAGATLLQVCGNPVMRDVSEKGAYSSNLSLAQSVKAVGSSLGFLLPPFVAKSLGWDWSILFPIYAVIVLVTLVSCLPLKLVTERDPSSKPATYATCFALFGGDRFVMSMVLGIFFYVGAEVCFSSGVPLLMKEKFGLDQFGLWVSWSLFFLPILVGRFVGAAVLKKLKPSVFLKLSVALAIAGVCAVFSGHKAVTFAGIVLVGLGFANIVPLIFSIAVDAMPNRSNEISGLMVTAIAGGAVLPPVMGMVADRLGVVGGFAVPLVALVYILWVALSQATRRIAA